LRGLSRVYPEREPLTEQQQAEIDALTARYEALIEEHGEDAPDETAAELEDISGKIDALSEDAERWLPEDIAVAGAVVGIGYNGELTVERGLVKPEDRPAKNVESNEAASCSSQKGNGVPGHSDRLIEDLTAHRTAALRTVLAGDAEVALAAVVHALALPIFFPHETDSCLGIKLDSVPLSGNAEGIEDGLAAVKLAERHQFWLRQMPNNAEALWDWLLAQDTAMRLDLLAYCAGCSVNAVKKRQERANSDRLNHADRLALTLGLDMTQWWQPTAQSYLRHVPKLRILEAVKEGVTPEAAENLAKLKKEALVTEAEKRLAGTGWLPDVLRSPIAVNAESEAMPIAAE
jgi:ParB family transcriptional regulator, chromosome partitioning protein